MSLSIVLIQSVSPVVTEMICHFIVTSALSSVFPIKAFLHQTPCSSASSPWWVGIMLPWEDAVQVGGKKLSGAQGRSNTCIWDRLG